MRDPESRHRMDAADTLRAGPRRVASLVFTGLVCAGLVGPAGAGSTESTKRDTTRLHLKGLSSAENRALDVTKVHVLRTGFGVEVQVSLRGDFDAAVGHGHLKDAGLAVKLTPVSSGRGRASVARSKPLVLLSANVNNRVRTLKHGSSGPVVVIRHPDGLKFLVANYRPSGRLKVQILAAPSLRRSRSAHSAEPVDRALQFLITTEEIFDRTYVPHVGTFPHFVSVFTPKPSAPCDDVRKLVAEARDELALAEQEAAMQVADHYVADADLVDVIAALKGLIRNGEAYVEEQHCNKPPVITSFKAVFPATCSTCTQYTVLATDPEGDPLTYTWVKELPGEVADVDPQTDCGTFTQAGNQAVWSHPNDGDHPCQHDAEDHPGWIKVFVEDDKGGQTSYIDQHGSANFSDPP